MKKVLKKYFIPHHENDYKPHFLREKSVFVLVLIIVFVLPLFSLLQRTFITKTGFTAAIVASVLADFANSDRIDLNSSPLVVNPLLVDAAKKKAEDMAQKGYFAHTSPEGLTPWYWLFEAGYNFSAAGENLAVDFSDSEEVNRAWLNSPGHRANILNSKFTEIGIATARGIYNGRETTFVVQFFGRPSAAETAAVSIQVVSPQNVSQIVSAKPEEEKSNEAGVAGEMFVSVGVPESESSPQAPETAIVSEKYASELTTLVSSPKKLLSYLYIILGTIIIIALLLNIFIEIRRQHPRHILYGLSLLVLIISLLYLQNYLFGSNVSII